MTSSTCPTSPDTALPSVAASRARSWRPTSGKPATSSWLKRFHAQPTYRFRHHRNPDGEAHRT
jgi:hypothetical protein